MALSMQCPSCGAAQQLENPGITVVVCGYCSSTLYRERDVLRAGRKSIVAEPRGDVVIGATGRVLGHDLTVLGRAQFSHGGGFWDEWYCLDATGRGWWLVEDEKAYALERPGGATDLDPRALPAPGATVRHMGTEFVVEEVGRAVCVGGEGQLPRAIAVGESYDFIDLAARDQDAVLAVEIDPDGTVEAFVGRPVAAEDVRFPPRRAVAGTPDAGPTVEAQAISCASCGGGLVLPPQGDPAQTAGCGHCGAVLQLDAAGHKVVGQNRGGTRFDFDVGDKTVLEATSYEVVGRMMTTEGPGENTREYLLWNRKRGYAWLDEYGGHFHLSRATSRGPGTQELVFATPGKRIDIAGRGFRFFEGGAAELVYVDGALPWLAQVGDRNQYWDLIDPPHCFAVELTEGRELERFVGRWLPPAEVYRAFGKPVRTPVGVGTAQPSPVGPTWRAVGWVVLAFALLNLLLALATLGAGPAAGSWQLRAEDFRPVGGGEPGRVLGTWTSPRFHIPEDARVVGLRLHAPLDNDWLWAEGELLVEGEEEAIGSLESEVSYYHGVDGGESWSEGSRKEARYAVAPPAGMYQLRVAVDAPPGFVLNVSLTLQERLTRWPIGLFALLLLFPAVTFVVDRAHESQRWGWNEED